MKRQKWLLFLIICIPIFFNSTSGVMALTRKALLIGIDEYYPNKIPGSLCRKNRSNLYGCVNDARAMASLLSTKYDFKEENIHVLLNEQATRANILGSYEKYLINDTAPEDVCVFYFSGHGSQVKNSKSLEPDKMDESLVPFDSFRGAKDIRDKELKKLFNRTLDQKAQLTVIIDACHSGSISKGIRAPLRFRLLPPDECDVADPPGNDENPAHRGALIFSAARDFGLASEIEDQDNISHGLFTWALLSVLRSAPNDLPAQHILMKVNAFMLAEGRLQVPNLEGPPGQRRNPLFGFKPGDRSMVTALVIRVEENTIILRGGIAAGIHKNCVLKKISGNDENGRNDTSSHIHIQVTAVEGLDRCTAKLLKGETGNIRKGDLFAIERWAAAPDSRLKACLPASTISTTELLTLAGELFQQCHSGNIDWITDPTVTNPSHIMSWNSTGWILQTPAPKPLNLGKNPSAAEVLRHIRLSLTWKDTKPGFFLQLPLSLELDNVFRSQWTDCTDSIEIVSPDRESHYILVGRYSGEKLEYAWVLPNLTATNEQALPLPVRTDWLPVGNECLRPPGTFSRKGSWTSKSFLLSNVLQGSRGWFSKRTPWPPEAMEKSNLIPETILELSEKIIRLAMIKAWLHLSSPPDSGGFPYHLALKNAKTQTVSDSGPLVLGESYGLVLRNESERDNTSIEKRYVYVFVIDSFGQSQLLFPLTEEQNTENRFPVEDTTPPKEIPLGKTDLITISKPLGIDTYILLTSGEPLSNPDVLSFDGVRRAEVKGSLTQLEQLLAGVGVKRRGGTPVTPTDWSIQRLSILSKPK